MSFLYGFGALQGLVLAGCLALVRSGHRLANQVMALLVLLIALRVLQKLLVHIDFWQDAPNFALVLFPSVYAWGPLLFLYALLLVGRSVSIAYSWHFALMAAIFLFSSVPFWMLSHEQKVELLSYAWSARNDPALEAAVKGLGGWYWLVLSTSVQHLLLPLQFSIYCLLVLRVIKQHNVHLRQQFSSVEQMNLKWLYFLTATIFVYLGLYLVSFQFPAMLMEGFDRTALSANVHNIFLILIIYGIGVAALFQPSIVSGLSDSQPARPAIESEISDRPQTSRRSPDSREVIADNRSAEGKYQRSGLSMEEAQGFRIQLMDLMQRQQLYLTNDLALSDLAEAAGLSTHQVSQVINSQLSQNFFSFVNNYRIQHAKDMLRDPATRDIPIVELAFEVGFKSKSAFYDAFKRMTGVTPTQYKRLEEKPLDAT
ncbi:MAG: helix-turn-helix domain-containing protein [Pseudomonadota bacterium]